MSPDPAATAAAHTCTSDPQEPCEPCEAAYLRLAVDVTAAGQIVAVCFGCRTPMEEADRPVYVGPHAILAAAGMTTRCRYCRELRPPNPGVRRLGIFRRKRSR